MKSGSKIVCARCQTPLSGARMLVEQVVIRVSDDAALGAHRNFIGLCPRHGRVGGVIAGHHATLSEAWTKARFSKAERVIIRMRLDGAERRRFDDALHGRYLPTEDDIVRWRSVLTSAPSTPR